MPGGGWQRQQLCWACGRWVTDPCYRRLLFRTCDHRSPAHHRAQRPHPQTEHRVRTYLGFGESRRPHLSLGWAAAGAIWVGGHFVPLVPRVRLSASGHVRLRSHSTCLQGERAALGMKAAVCVGRTGFAEEGAASRREPCSLTPPPCRLGCEGTPPVPSRQHP